MAGEVPALGAWAAVDDRAQRHDCRAYIPKNAEASLARLNDHWAETPGLTDREAFNAFFADAVAEYDAGRKPSRRIGADYYDHFSKQKAKGSGGERILLEEVSLGAGDRDSVGVTDDGFDGDVWKGLKDADREAGVAPGSPESRAGSYVREHLRDPGALDRDGCGFDVARWRAARDADRAAGRKPGDAGSAEAAYVEEFMGSATVMDRQRAALLLVRELWNERYPQLHLIRFDVHVDEPNGTPHAHACYIPWTRSGKTGPKMKCSMKQALADMGFKNRKGALAVEQLRADMRGLVRECYEEMGFEIEDKGIRRERLRADVYAETMAKVDRETKEAREANAAQAAKNAADAERNAAMRRIISENAAWNEEEARALDRRAEELERDARDARVEISHEQQRLNARRREADRMRARAEVALHGYTPPDGVTLVPPSAMPPELRELWRFADGDEGDDAVYDIADDLWPEGGEPDLGAIDTREIELADELARSRGYAQAYVDGDGAWLVSAPLEYVREQPGYEDIESTDELTDDDRLYWSEKWWNEASLRIADAQVLGLDPTVAHPGIDEREAAVEAARADVERRDRIVGEREAAFERLEAKRRSAVDALDAEIEARRAEAARLDAEADEKTRWLEGAVEHVKEADAYVEQAREDAEATRRAAEADAERTRERARAEAREGVSSAVGDAGARVSRLVAEFTSSVVGNVCQLAFATLKAMRDNMALGDEFNHAATTCMVTLHQVVEQDRDGSIARAIEDRARDVMNAAFKKRACREVVEPVFEDDWEPRPQTGRSRDDVPGL